MSAPAPQCAASSLSTLPQCMLSHTSRDIKYIFLDGCKNIAASHAPTAAGTHKVYKGSLSSHPKQAKGSGHFVSKKRLLVFQQLCGEAMPAMALGDMHLQNSSQELKELPDAKAPREDTKGWRMRQAAGCSPCNKA
ncbi:hypothetical protein N327_12201 [Fulmarus glacialis]|uniref:Uncharacterized protein n=1 Tax=Fulmarus glacialis TaxID=30455 RepID=A0A093KR30_FULGA|nr:hypothetical protein N327_12201 [Fulmarus glacialis]